MLNVLHFLKPNFDISFSASSIKVSGKEFRPGAIVCTIAPSDSAYPTFGEIVRVFVPNGARQFLINLYKTELFSFHYNAYKVVKTNMFEVICISQLKLHEAFHKYCVSSSLYVVIKSFHHVEFDT